MSGERDAVLFANEAFYLAFRTGDLAAMDALWAQRAPVSCIHPGWAALTGRERVMGGWSAILRHGSGGQIECRHAEVQQYGESALVICYEVLDGTVLVACNGFVKQDGRWRMVHHQAGPANMVPGELAMDDDSSSDTEGDPGSNMVH
ncbi:MAG: nuclear transport factor 2 family protein [Alphaproteobacteria bacterium]|jgi:ketosteroid isomerase-like protein